MLVRRQDLHWGGLGRADGERERETGGGVGEPTTAGQRVDGKVELLGESKFPIVELIRKLCCNSICLELDLRRNDLNK